MTKRIILLSDGTGNAVAKVWRSNVWRLFESLALLKPNQVAIYDDGVGTASFKPLALLGGAFGWGLKRNAIDLYAFLCRNYEEGAEIFGFGFSRGAFTMRIVAGLVVNQGVILAKEADGEVDLQRLAHAAYRAYRRQRFHSILRIEWPFRLIRDGLTAMVNFVRGRKAYDPAKNAHPDIRFLGLWDTVAAYGLPIDEMTRGFSQWIWPLEFPDRVLSSKVRRACHALSLDDERTTFHPMLWTEAGEVPPPSRNGYRLVKDERLSQVWFAGTHANVGGGYPDDRLAHVPLVWIMRQAALCGLEFKQAPEDDPDAIRHALSAADKDGRLYDSRHGLAGYYRYGPRKIAELCAPHYTPVVALLARLLRMEPSAVRRWFPEKDVVEIDEPKIHFTAIERMLNGAFAYAPIGFPPKYAVVDIEGRILEGPNNPFEPPDEARARAAAQERVWNWVWFRRLVYFVTLFASANLALFPLREIERASEFESPLPLVSKVVRLVGAFMPGFLQWWVDAFAARPQPFVFALGLVVGLILFGVYLGAHISDAMRGLWNVVRARRETASGAPPLPPPPTDLLFRLRTTDGYRTVFWLLKRAVLPLLSAILILYLGAAALNRLMFNVEDGWGVYCHETRDPGATTDLVVGQTESREFKTSDVCWGSRILLRERGRYELTLAITSQWVDGRNPGITSGVEGYELGEVPSLAMRGLMLAAIPLRRNPWVMWLRPIARVGARGADEYPLDLEAPGTVRSEYQNDVTFVIRPRRGGELFLYVNDAVVGLHRDVGFFYESNQGSATLKVRRMR
jgi:uncharacterized protein (DUF2235 family)